MVRRKRTAGNLQTFRDEAIAGHPDRLIRFMRCELRCDLVGGQ